MREGKDETGMEMRELHIRNENERFMFFKK